MNNMLGNRKKEGVDMGYKPTALMIVAVSPSAIENEQKLLGAALEMSKDFCKEKIYLSVSFPITGEWSGYGFDLAVKLRDAPVDVINLRKYMNDLALSILQKADVQGSIEIKEGLARLF